MTVLSITGVMLLLLIWNIDPSQASWMPKCTLKLLTGYDCPSCGATRSIHALMHGEIVEAIRYNYFAVIAVLYVLFVVLATRFNARIRKIVLGRVASIVYIVLFFTWWIVRNILEI